MADGWSRLRIFNPQGYLLTEYDAPTKRSWVLNDVGRCEFAIPVYDAFAGGFNPKLTAINFAYGNLVLVDHKPSVNSDGTTNGVLPQWVGVILPPQTWDYGKVQFTAYSAEQILLYRPLFIEYVTGCPGGIFRTILEFSNRYARFAGGGIQIQYGNIDLSGSDIPISTQTTALQQIQAYAQATGYDWDITPQVNQGNQLVLYANWYKKKGIDSGQVMSNTNLLNASPMYTEQGQLYNAVLGFNSAKTPGTRTQAISSNVAGISANGVLGLPHVFPGTDAAAQPVIQTMTDAYLANQSTINFIRTFAPTVLDVGNAFSFCATGNTWLVQNDWAGFNSRGGIGVNGSIRITAVEYNDMTNQCSMAGALQ